MQSRNFDFLRAHWPELSDLGALAEQYAYPDPESALVKLRLFGEALVGSVYHRLRLPRLSQGRGEQDGYPQSIPSAHLFRRPGRPLPIGVAVCFDRPSSDGTTQWGAGEMRRSKSSSRITRFNMTLVQGKQ